MTPTEDSPPAAHLEDAPLRPPEVLRPFGRTLVVAPHPDDESLGCGGAIALLRAMGHDVRVLFATDGSRSHPASRRYPAPKLAALREEEALAALAILGVDEGAVQFLRLPDRAVPVEGEAAFGPVTTMCGFTLANINPDTILLPWRRDPHPDHRATWGLISHSAPHLPRRRGRPARLIEYPIWLWELGAEEDAPRPGEVAPWRLDISAVLPRKLGAIGAHRSQTTDLIDDDPTGFRLTPDILAHFARPWELFLEACD